MGDGIQKGGMNDPVAQSIRAEQQTDAMPSAAEAKREHRRNLAKKGCQVCGEDDPGELQRVRIPMAFCGNDQPPKQPFKSVVFCDEHARSASTLKRARIVQQARNDDADVVVIYDCGATVTTSWDRPDDDGLARRSPRLAEANWDDLRTETKLRVGQPPSIPAFHVGRGCGATIDEVIVID